MRPPLGSLHTFQRGAQQLRSRRQIPLRVGNVGVPQIRRKLWQMALHIDPYVYWGHFRMARVFEKNKDTESAIKQYEFLVRYAFDRDPDVYLKLATLYKDAGRKRDALRVLRKGRRILATNPAIYRLYREVLDAT